MSMSAVAANHDDQAKNILVLVIGCFTSSLSVMGSSCVIYMTCQRNAKQKIINRLLLCLSICDFLSSSSSLVMPFTIPSGGSGLPGAIGNHASCTASGFFLVAFGKAGCCYNTYLSVYYYLVVKRNWKEYDFHRWKELLAHCFAFGLPLVVDILAATTQSINPFRLIDNLCVYAVSPTGCGIQEEDNNVEDFIPCDRSSPALVNKFMFFCTPWLSIVSCIGFACTGIVYFSVRNTIRKSNAYRFSTTTKSTGTFSRTSTTSDSKGNSSACQFSATNITTTTTATTAETISSNTKNQDNNDNDKQDERIRQVAIQAVLYALAYLNSSLWPALAHILDLVLDDTSSPPPTYWLKLLYWTFYPLQGFFNFFIFTRQKRKIWREAHPDKSVFWIYLQILQNKPTPPPLPKKKRQQHQQHPHHGHDSSLPDVISKTQRDSTLLASTNKTQQQESQQQTIAVAANIESTTHSDAAGSNDNDNTHSDPTNACQSPTANKEASATRIPEDAVESRPAFVVDESTDCHHA